jgi:hypothetical protein
MAMKLDAIRIAVRGFGTRADGDRIIDKLANIGFDLAETIDPKCDDLGGVIETLISPVDDLDLDDYDDPVPEIKAKILAGEDVACFVQWDGYEQVDGDNVD